jgi:glycosyltransferase involved in cell wall biosynthesis
MMVAPFSVLMATHEGESAANLSAALHSVFDQTSPPEDVVLVLDGPVGDEQEHVINALSQQAACPLHLVRLPARSGLAHALNAGLPSCRSEYIARMDSDDVSVPTRFETQSRVLKEHYHIDVLASWHAEFVDDPERPIRTKQAPEPHEEIVRILRWRNVLSHPTIVVRRSALEAVGGYHPMGLLEDWDLYLRLARHGAVFQVVPEALVKVRISQHAERRGGFGYFRDDFRFRYICLRRGDIGIFGFVLTVAVYGCWRLMPARGRRMLYPLWRTNQRGMT